MYNTEVAVLNIYVYSKNINGDLLPHKIVPQKKTESHILPSLRWILRLSSYKKIAILHTLFYRTGQVLDTVFSFSVSLGQWQKMIYNYNCKSWSNDKLTTDLEVRKSASSSSETTGTSTILLFGVVLMFGVVLKSVQSSTPRGRLRVKWLWSSGENGGWIIPVEVPWMHFY